jgi:hypothetical protein
MGLNPQVPIAPQPIPFLGKKPHLHGLIKTFWELCSSFLAAKMMKLLPISFLFLQT